MPRDHALPASQLGAVLDRRTADLARPRHVDGRGPGLPVISFLCADGLYGLPVTAVSEVLSGRRPIRWPGAPASVLGLVGHAGRTIAVLDLATLLGMPARQPGGGMMIVLKVHERRLALEVDRATGMIHVDPPADVRDGEASAGPVRWATIRGPLPDAPQTLALLDADRLTASLAPTGPSSIAPPAGA